MDNGWNQICRRMQGVMKTRCSAAVFISFHRKVPENISFDRINWQRGKMDGLVSDMDIDENGNTVDRDYVFSWSLGGAAGCLGTF